LCPHRETSYSQTTRLDVADGGEVLYVDAFAPGRVARGETWAWRRLQLALDVCHAGEPVLRERLDGSGAAMAHLASRYGTPVGWFGTMVAISPRLASADDPDGPWARVHALHRGGEGLWVGASRLRHGGWIIRVIAPDGQAWRDALCEIRGLLASRLPRLGSDLRKL
jgi:urease accessory protein